ncbi:MAG: alpha/beta hydrolase [Phycisphaerales bacterium]|nr:alpha/beta hydrolase [Phycisphaerales bacterium]
MGSLRWPTWRDRLSGEAGGGGVPGEAPAESRAARRRRLRQRSLRRWLVRGVVLLLVLLYSRTVGFDRHLFYYPSREQYDHPTDFGLRHEDVFFETDDGVRLHGWWLFAQGPPRGIVVHFHGNAANVTAHVGLIEWLPHAGYHVLLFDYRGFGRSEGTVSRRGTIRDGHAAVTFAAQRPEAGELPLFGYGQSLGGAVGIVVAAERLELRAIVAESTFSGYGAIARAHARRVLPVPGVSDVLAWLIVGGGYDPIDVVHRLAPRPVLIIAAERDETCFPELAERLYAAAGEPKAWWLVPGARHLEIVGMVRGELIERVTKLFENAPPP